MIKMNIIQSTSIPQIKLENNLLAQSSTKIDTLSFKTCSADFYPRFALNDLSQPNVILDISSRLVKAYWYFPNINHRTEYVLGISCLLKNGKYGETELISTEKINHEFYLKPGHTYKLDIWVPYKHTPRTMITKEFKTTFADFELEMLYNRAELFVKQTVMVPVNLISRCKPSDYWDQLISPGGSNPMITPQIKDANGHKESSIVGQIRCIPFTVNKLFDSKISNSCFGDTCLTVHISKVFNPDDTNAYFADFYDFSPKKARVKTYFVTIIFCKKGSPADTYCFLNTKKLDICKNPFFQLKQDVDSFTEQSKYKFYTNPQVEVEILYTDFLSFVPDALHKVEIINRQFKNSNFFLLFLNLKFKGIKINDEKKLHFFYFL